MGRELAPQEVYLGSIQLPRFLRSESNQRSNLMSCQKQSRKRSGKQLKQLDAMWEATRIEFREFIHFIVI